MKRTNAPKVFLVFTMALALILPVLTSTRTVSAAAITGAIFTTDSVCNGTNVNIFDSKADVYLDGGPAHTGAAGLPPGFYYVQVTEPNGTLLGKTTTASVEVNSDGEFVTCYQLSAILSTASSGFTAPGYDTTSNNGGEYKVWASMNPAFPNDESKTDNFKVRDEETTPPEQNDPVLHVRKFYDANANGLNDDGQLITGWKITIEDGIFFVRFTPVDITLAPDDYVVTEATPNEGNWISTTPNPVNVTLALDDDKTVEFGNLCLGGGGGHTLGFWSNKNGQATMNDGGSLCPELTLLNNLCLRNGSGVDQNFACNYNSFRSWLLNATATNMAYMLSAQLAAMKLNVEAGFVSGSALIFAPGATSANGLGFATISDILAEAEAELCAHGDTTSGGPGDAFRSYQEALKNALDKANNNQNFVQATPCPFSFAD